MPASIPTWNIPVAIHVIIGLLLTIHILLTKYRPTSCLLWIGLVWLFPGVGAIAYAVFGRDVLPASAALGRFVAEAAARAGLADAGTGAPEDWPQLTGAGQVPPRAGNQVELLVDGTAFYPALFAAIDAATTSIHLQSFIIAADPVGRELLDRCIEARQRGVRVRILYDRLGSTAAHFKGFFRGAKAAGLDIRSLSEVWPLRGRFFISMRNHRKIAVIDGATSFIGGINIHGDNQGDATRPASIRDYHVQLTGPAVSDLQAVFLTDWFRATGEARVLHDGGSFPVQRSAGDSIVQVVPGSPMPDGSDLAETIFTCAVTARRRLTLVTPYFVPDEPTFEAIRNAARRGVEVTLLTPRRGNHWYATCAARSLFERLLEVGVRVAGREPPFLHGKLLLVDDRYALVGSANLDYRSLHLNFEANLFIDDPRFAAACAAQVALELEASTEYRLEDMQAQSLGGRLLDRACYLFQPLL